MVNKPPNLLYFGVGPPSRPLGGYEVLTFINKKLELEVGKRRVLGTLTYKTRTNEHDFTSQLEAKQRNNEEYMIDNSASPTTKNVVLPRSCFAKTTTMASESLNDPAWSARHVRPATVALGPSCRHAHWKCDILWWLFQHVSTRPKPCNYSDHQQWDLPRFGRW